MLVPTASMLYKPVLMTLKHKDLLTFYFPFLLMTKGQNEVFPVMPSDDIKFYGPIKLCLTPTGDFHTLKSK